VRVLTTYGLTEACSQVTSQSPLAAPRAPASETSPTPAGETSRAPAGETSRAPSGETSHTPAGETSRAPSIRRAGSGAPLPGMEVRIVAEGSADLAPLPPRTVGQILIRGPALFDGYLLPDGTIAGPWQTVPSAVAPASDACRSPPSPAGAVATGGRSPDVAASDAAPPAGTGFFPTGDLGELDEEGQLHVHVRRTDLVVTGGENVYPVEVEHAIEQIPGVRRAAVFGVPDERWGQIVAAAVEWEGAAPCDTSSLVDVLSTSLAPHKRPRKWAIVEQLPLTGSGKLLRAGLAEMYGSILRSPGLASGLSR
jgi:O-succinylbenzoic acid--CoA ligase